MIGIKVSILAFMDDSQPGWVRCTFKDAHGEEHFFVEKIPIVTTELLDETSLYPVEGVINGVLVNEQSEQEMSDTDLITVDTTIPFGICSEDQKNIFHVFKHQLMMD